MNPLTDLNIESELSYAYIHAVASHSGASCDIGTRHEDNAGVDAKLTAWGPFPGGGYRTEVDVKVQLKATIKPPIHKHGYLSYSLKGIPQYDDLRSEAVSIPRILVVLFLPKEKSSWLSHTKDALSLCKCAYWVSLRGAAASTNATSQTVYIPDKQKLDVSNLNNIFADISKNSVPVYDGGP
ncbi:DUF4365 domain-containing protein [Pseudophaeobacter leonis]|uniref:DUF4365 domain-containing protein n=1 Tax=Pseudophaeobacter leonis TaxID=1144477 RepID=UPI0013748168|nr:DUF4365 domain-containing protein [Pseudophaeobacter leonis]